MIQLFKYLRRKASVVTRKTNISKALERKFSLKQDIRIYRHDIQYFIHVNKKRHTALTRKGRFHIVVSTRLSLS